MDDVTKKAEEIEQQLFSRSLSDTVAKLSYFRRLERVWQLIEAEYTNPELSLERAAKVSGVSKNHLNKLLRQTINFTFHQFLIRYRLLKAVNMMKAKNYSLLEIALKNGFGSMNTFERNFHRVLRISPKQFKSNRDFR